jgi:hypothetical protein
MPEPALAFDDRLYPVPLLDDCTDCLLFENLPFLLGAISDIERFGILFFFRLTLLSLLPSRDLCLFSFFSSTIDTDNFALYELGILRLLASCYTLG